MILESSQNHRNSANLLASKCFPTLTPYVDAKFIRILMQLNIVIVVSPNVRFGQGI